MLEKISDVILKITYVASFAIPILLIQFSRSIDRGLKRSSYKK
jgi:hypothetical protein